MHCSSIRIQEGTQGTRERRASERKPQSNDTYDCGAELTRDSFCLCSIVGRAAAEDTGCSAGDEVVAVTQAVEVVTLARTGCGILDARVGAICQRYPDIRKSSLRTNDRRTWGHTGVLSGVEGGCRRGSDESREDSDDG